MDETTEYEYLIECFDWNERWEQYHYLGGAPLRFSKKEDAVFVMEQIAGQRLRVVCKAPTGRRQVVAALVALDDATGG